MRITVGQLRSLFANAVAEAKVGASDEYMKKERVREHMQEHILDMVKSGEITDQEGIDAWCEAADMSLKALKMIPFEVYAKMAGKGT